MTKPIYLHPRPNDFHLTATSFKKDGTLICARCQVAVMSQRLLKKHKGKSVCRDEQRCGRQRALHDA